MSELRRRCVRSRLLWPGWALCLAAPLLTACPPAEDDPAKEDEFDYGEKLGLPACTDDIVAENEGKRCHTFRALAGVSMGGGTASRLGFTYPELFDVVGVMGTPFSDNEFFWGMAERNHLAGFCPLEQLEQVMDELGPDELDNPNNPDVFCGVHDVFPIQNGEQADPGLFPAVEGSACSMFRSDFNHWYRGPDEGRGGGFSRNSIIEIFHDLIAAYGNPLYYLEGETYFPPGVPDTWHAPPQDNSFDAAAFCNNPIVIEGFYNREYNPDGTYPVITFCDGATGNTGDYTPDDEQRYRNLIEFALAVDLNGNGRRDYGEPIVINNRERYRDVGLDGLADIDEAGYDPVTNKDPAGDNWNPMTNPDGNELNMRWDDGEPYDDDGLDGVPATADYGEGNGVYDISPVLDRTFDRSPSRLYRNMTDAQVDRIDVWLDAGIRDFINSTQITNALYSEIAARVDDARVYDDFSDMPGLPPGQGYQFYLADYSTEAMGQAAYLRYGDAAICPGSDDVLGEGNHVGPGIVHRIYTLFSFLSARMPAEGRDRSIGGTIADLESPNGKLTDFGFMDTYDSEALGHEVDYGILLPPDYFLDDKQEYPVLYFFHGQGQTANDMVAVGLLLFGYMQGSTRADRQSEGLTDFQRAIIVWVDGECRGDECWTGNFYADFEGRPRDDRQWEKGFIELMHHVETKYRVRTPDAF